MATLVRSAKAAVFLLSLVSAGSASADVFKRVESNGTVTYSDEVGSGSGTVDLYESSGIVPAPPAGGAEAAAFEKRREIRIRRSAIQERLTQARHELEAARSALAGGIDSVEATVGPDQLAAGPAGGGLVAAFATANAGASATRPTASAGGGVGTSRSVTGGNAGLDALGSALSPTGGIGAPGLGPGATGGLSTTGTSRTATGGAGHRTAAVQPRAFARYTDKVEFLAEVVARREAEIASLSAALESLR